MENKKEGNVRGGDVSPVECPVGCWFFTVCWLISVEEIPVDIIWSCIGKGQGHPLKDVPIGAWTTRPGMNEALELSNS